MMGGPAAPAGDESIVSSTRSRRGPEKMFSNSGGFSQIPFSHLIITAAAAAFDVSMEKSCDQLMKMEECLAWRLLRKPKPFPG